jgi:predicted membrane-bound spermidine synthase
MNKTYLYVSISVSGASILAVEILGTRIIGPFYGVDLFLWSALISVTLAALAAGYWLGGRWADRGPTMGRFSSLFVAAGLWLVLLPFLRGTAIEIARPLGHRAALLSAAALLFFPPLAILGMVSPYALKLRVRSVGEVGRSAGNLYAVSTLASVAAALLVGFLLVPGFGVKSLASAIGIILAATGAAGLFIGRVFSAGRRPRAAGEPRSQ